jgi:hypothetical protein
MKTILMIGLFAAALGTWAQPVSNPGGPDRNRPGPWDNDVLVYRVAPAGEPEKLATFERAGVPTVARLKDGRLLAAHQHFPENDDANFDKVAVHFSTDEGRIWTAPQVIRVSGLPEDMRFPFDPTLVPLPDGRVRLYFTGNRRRPSGPSTPAIHSATSKDGVDYTYEPGVRFGIEGRIVIDCAVALHEGVFHLIVPDNGARDDFMARPRRGRQPIGGTGYHATSTDGLKFERVSDVKLPSSRDRWLGSLASDGGKLVFFGTGPGNWPFLGKDGATWEGSVRPTRLPGADPGAVKLRDGSWLLLVTGEPRPGTPSAAAMPRKGAFAPDDEEQQRAPGPGLRPQSGTGGEPGLIPFQSIFLRIPSGAAGKEGVAASVLLPRQPRFTNGAPVVINVTGGVQAGSARGRPEYVRHGFVEIHFAFPGGGVGEERSGGSYDFRGSNCVRALADVIRFATGRVADAQGRRISGLARGFAVQTNNVGFVGSSHGGNACGLAMAKFGSEFPNLAWYASMESPYGEGAANVELGGRESGLNPAYNPQTGLLDLSALAWSGELTPGLMRKPMLVDTRELRGALFFDLNGDGRFSRENDFPANGFLGDAGGGVKAWYSPRLLIEAGNRKLLPEKRPAHLPTLAEAREFWSWRDAATHIPDAVRACPNVAVIVYANERDHVQADPAHTHILVQVEGFRQADAKFVRLNPDRAYVERITADLPPRMRAGAKFPDNPAGKTWTRVNIAEGLEPSSLPLGLYMQAAVCELADRTQAGQWSANVEAVLFPDTPKPVLPRPGRFPEADTPGFPP